MVTDLFLRYVTIIIRLLVMPNDPMMVKTTDVVTQTHDGISGLVKYSDSTLNRSKSSSSPANIVNNRNYCAYAGLEVLKNTKCPH